MKTEFPEISLHRAALAAGISIVVMTVAAIISTDLTIGKLIVDEEPAITYENIRDNQLLFRAGIFSWVVVLVSDMVAAWGLYIVLRPVNNSLSLLSAWLRIVYTAILGTSILNYTYVLELLDTSSPVAAFQQTAIVSETWVYLSRFDSSWSLGLIVFGLHIFLLGYLALKSAHIPRVIAIILLIGATGYFLIHTATLLIPQHQGLIAILQWVFILPMLSEVALGVWLLVKPLKLRT